MEPTVLGIVLDSRTVIAAERKKLEVVSFIEEILQTHGSVDLSLSPVTVGRAWPVPQRGPRRRRVGSTGAPG